MDMRSQMKQLVAGFIKKHPDIRIKRFIWADFAVDVSRDRQYYFLWLIHEFGTELFELRPDFETDSQFARHIDDFKRGGEYYGTITEFYIAKNGELRRIGVDEASEMLNKFRLASEMEKTPTVIPTFNERRPDTPRDVTSRLGKVPVTEILSDGSRVINLNSNAADADFIRTWRLLRRIEKGDEAAQAQLDALEAEPTYWDTRFD